jgi:type 1 fimbriae regulatory protein FimB/type 1 fimbriae regulatory protein FimE
MDNSSANVEASAIVNPTVPLRRPNAELRTREYLTQAEVTAIIERAKQNRQGHRDATMILIAFSPGAMAFRLGPLLAN